ncbi:MAG: sorbosone dehydrogenase, partial [Marinobacter sp.]|nr:sorbosone dehydrogenase [Marinobacter sp.]
MNKKTSILCVAASLAFVPFAHSQSDNTLKKLGNFQTTGKAEFTVIDQNSDSADAIRKTLEKIQ